MAHGGSHHHHHHHGPTEAGDDESTRRIGWAFWLNLGFACFELVGGFYIQSLAVISDALHDFGDALSLGMGYFLQRKSKQGPTETFSYGFRRLSLLSALLTGLVISGGAIFVVWESLTRFNEPHSPHAPGMMVFAVIGIAVNGFAAWKLGRGHSHSHNEKMIRWHLLEDVMGWVAVLIGAIGILLFGWTWLDPFLAIAISLFVLYNISRGFTQTISLFLQANPNPPALRQFRDKVLALNGVKDVHDVHFWSLDGVRHVLSMHLVLKEVETAPQLKEQIRKLSQELGDCHVTIEIESPQEHCHNDCEHGQAESGGI